MTSRRILAEIRDLRADAARRDDRAHELMAENRELMAEIHTELALNRNERAETFELYRGEVQVTREVIRRNERVMSELVDAVREIKEEVRAQTRAIFKLIDRLDGGAATA